MNVNTLDAFQLCRSLLAFTSPGTSVAVPHAALAQIVEMASGGAGKCHPVSDPEHLDQLYDVAALARRYNRALPTVRQWFHDGLFGPPEERRFRGRGYVASADAVREFEIRTGLKAGVPERERERRSEVGTPMSEVEPPVPLPPEVARSPRVATRTSGIGGKIFAEARGGRSRRVARQPDLRCTAGRTSGTPASVHTPNLSAPQSHGATKGPGCGLQEVAHQQLSSQIRDK